MRVSKMTVYRLVHAGDLPAVRVGRSFRVPEKACAPPHGVERARRQDRARQVAPDPLVRVNLLSKVYDWRKSCRRLTLTIRLARLLGSYVIVARVGGGGMGVVYKARTRSSLAPSPSNSFPRSGVTMTARSSGSCARRRRLPPPTIRNICTIHDIAETDDGQLFIVMAYYEGVTLKRKLEGGPLPVDEALEIATEIADGLAKAHAQGVVHRDVKPGNLMITDDGVDARLRSGQVRGRAAADHAGSTRRHRGLHVARTGARAERGCAVSMSGPW